MASRKGNLHKSADFHSCKHLSGGAPCIALKIRILLPEQQLLSLDIFRQPSQAVWLQDN